MPQVPPSLKDLIQFYETLQPETISAFGRYYAADARFKDPFNDVTGRPAIERIFRHMFVQADAPRFEVTGCYLPSGTTSDLPREAMLRWTFHFHSRLLNPRQTMLVGSTHLCFDDAGLVTLHRDYWDASEELFSRVRGLGGVMRAMRRALAAR